MYVNVSQRFTLVIKYLLENRLLKNQAELTQILSLSKGYVSQLVNGQREPSSEVVSKLANSFPIINENWLLTGMGAMLKEDSETQPQNVVAEQPQEQGMIDKLLFLVESQRKDIEVLIQLVKNKDEKIEELLDKLDARKKGNATDVVSSSSASAV